MTSASASIGSVSTATCERIPIARPASSAPASSRRGGGFPAISASAHIAAAKPSMSLSGRSAVNQKSGEAATTSVAHRARSSRPSRRRKSRNSAGIAAAPPIALQIASPRGDAASTPAARSAAGRRLGQRDVDRIAGRMRLVLRDVEVPDAEREVDRVDVLERPGQEREVREQEGQDQRDAGRSLAVAH